MRLAPPIMRTWDEPPRCSLDWSIEGAVVAEKERTRGLGAALASEAGGACPASDTARAEPLASRNRSGSSSGHSSSFPAFTLAVRPTGCSAAAEHRQPEWHCSSGSAFLRPGRPGHPPAAPQGCLCLADRGGPAPRQHQSSRIRPGLVQRRHQRDAARTVHSHHSGLPHARRGRAPAGSPLLGHFARKFDAQGPARGVAAAQAPIHWRPGASADPGGPAGAPGPSCGDFREKQPRLQVASQPRVRP